MTNRIIIQIIVPNLTDADTIKAQVLDQLNGKNFLKFQVSVETWKTKTYVTAEVDFNDKAERDAMYLWIKDTMTKGALKNKFLTNSKISIHTCYDDEGGGRPCDSVSLSEYQEIIK